MDKESAKLRVLEMLPDMMDNFGHKELAYMDYRDNSGDSDTASRLFAEFETYRDKHNNYVNELKELRQIIQDDIWVDTMIEKEKSKWNMK